MSSLAEKVFALVPRGDSRVLAGLADGVLVVGTDGRIASANTAVAGALGIPAPELLGRDIDGVLTTMDDEPVRAKIDAVLAQGPWRGHVARRTGGPEAGVWDAVICVAPDRPGAVVAVLRDVSERYHAEQVRADFLSMVVHDIKGPLTVILGYAELMSEGGPCPAELLDDTLGRIRESGEQIQALVSNFLELSRIEVGRLALDRQPADLRGITERVVEQHESRARRKQITLVWEPIDVPTQHLDVALMERAIANLVGNAIKYTPAGGRVTVALERRGQDVVLAVRDDGPGIPLDDLPYIFQKYRRARSAKRVEGTGLGLFITKTVIAAHGGDVTVETAIGHGSTFRLVLPA